jgi:N-acetylmuramoyl-L-alanine amidase
MRSPLRPVLTALAGAGMVLAGCTTVEPRFTPGIATRWIASPNFDSRRPQFVVLHHTSNGTAGQALATLTNPARMVSAHYLVARDGTIYQLVDERHRAWHAGTSRWGSDEDLNSSSIGIELDNDGAEPYPAAQIDALLALLADLRSRYDIPRENFLGHGDIAPGRKVDPGALFPWQRLAERGFGAWCDPGSVAPAQIGAPAAVPADDATLLGVLGYDTDNLEATIRAFNRHFMAREDDPVLSAQARAMLECLAASRVRVR